MVQDGVYEPSYVQWGTTSGPTFLRTANSPLPEKRYDSTHTALGSHVPFIYL